MDDSRTNTKIPFRKSDGYLIIFLIAALLLVNAILNLLFGQSYKKYAQFNINNVSTYVWNNGEMDISPSRKGGFIYPKENNVPLFFESGLILGGKINRVDNRFEIRVQGSDYTSSFLPGRVLKSGEPENPFDESNRVFKVRPDYTTADLKDEIEYNFIINRTLDDKEDTTFLPALTEEEIRENYKNDWNEWPAEKGVPFEDVNGNGFYDPQVDIPGVKGADQTLWFVMNDFDEQTAKDFAGSPPLGLEIQVTVWGYKNYNYLDDYVFKEYKIINKSDSVIKEMFTVLFADPDIGNSKDDFVGCDTILNLGYCYNGGNNDINFPNNTPSVGYSLLDNNKIKVDLKAMSSFAFSLSGSFVSFGNEYAEGTLEYYNLFHGRIGTTGQSFIDPITKLSTKYCLSGDPITRIGWTDGYLHPPGERTFLMSSGPFDLAPNDTVKFVVAQFAAFGRDRLSSVTFLKRQARFIQSLYPNFEELKKEVIPHEPKNVSAQSNFNNSITINWDKETEKYLEKGYEFQGYNVYQFCSKHNLLDNAIKIETFDKIDDVREIYGLTKHPASGTAYIGTIQTGKNSGIKNTITVKNDFTKNIPFTNGKDYWFGISSYYYNKENGKVVESEINQIKITTDFSKENYSEINRYKLLQNYPNPFNPATKIKLTIPYAGDAPLRQGQTNVSPVFASLKVFDILGREVQTLYSGEISEGEHEVDFNGSSLSSGIYFYMLSVNNKIIDKKKMVLLK